MFHNLFTSKKNRVAILVHKKLNLVILNQKKDDEGRMCIQATSDELKVNICTVYAPNRDNSNFIHMVNKTIRELEEGQMLIAGDFNQVKDTHLD